MTDADINDLICQRGVVASEHPIRQHSRQQEGLGEKHRGWCGDVVGIKMNRRHGIDLPCLEQRLSV